MSVRTQQYGMDNTGKLFDMVADPGQIKDISKTKPGIAANLRQVVAKWENSVLSELKRDERPFVIAHPNYAWTQIPARDATAHGDIKCSNRFPNCSYFTNWTKLEDKITWQTEVGATGKYEATLHYAVPKSLSEKSKV